MTVNVDMHIKLWPRVLLWKSVSCMAGIPAWVLKTVLGNVTTSETAFTSSIKVCVFIYLMLQVGSTAMEDVGNQFQIKETFPQNEQKTLCHIFNFCE